MLKGIAVSPREKTIVPLEKFEEFRDHCIVLLAFQIVIDREIFVVSFCNIRLGKWEFAEFEFVTTIVVFGDKNGIIDECQRVSKFEIEIFPIIVLWIEIIEEKCDRLWVRLLKNLLSGIETFFRAIIVVTENKIPCCVWIGKRRKLGSKIGDGSSRSSRTLRRRLVEIRSLTFNVPDFRAS